MYNSSNRQYYSNSQGSGKLMMEIAARTAFIVGIEVKGETAQKACRRSQASWVACCRHGRKHGQRQKNQTYNMTGDVQRSFVLQCCC